MVGFKIASIVVVTLVYAKIVVVEPIMPVSLVVGIVQMVEMVIVNAILVIVKGEISSVDVAVYGTLVFDEHVIETVMVVT